MWIAVYFGIVVALGVGAYAAWAGPAIGKGAAAWPFVVGFPFAYLAVPLVFTSVWMFLGWIWRSERPAAVELDGPSPLRVFWNEFMSLAQAPRMIVYALVMRDPPPAPSTLPLLLLHGIG